MVEGVGEIPVITKEEIDRMPTMPSYDDGKKDGAIEAFQILSLQPSNCDVDDGKQNCLECEEYNHEKHYCPKFCDVIREAVKDIRKDSIPVSYIKDTIKWAKENGSDEYADYLSHLLSMWAEEMEEE